MAPARCEPHASAPAERAGNKPAFRVYQVMRGAPGETYWLFGSQATMAGFDAKRATTPKTEAEFTADDAKVFEEFFAKAVMSTNSNLWSYSSGRVFTFSRWPSRSPL